VAEVLIGLLRADPDSYLVVDPSWRPTLPSHDRAGFNLTDLVTFAAAAGTAELLTKMVRPG
jgi:hypothetical protein